MFIWIYCFNSLKLKSTVAMKKQFGKILFQLLQLRFFKPHHRWKILGGYGVEMEKNENFQLIRIGAEYGIELPKNWELGFTFEYDFKINGYYTLLLGIGFTKKFVKQQ